MPPTVTESWASGEPSAAKPGNRPIEIIDEQRGVMQPLRARTVREHVMQRGWIGIVLDHQLHHDAAPLAIGAGMVEGPLHPAMLRGRERHMVQHERTGPIRSGGDCVAAAASRSFTL